MYEDLFDPTEMTGNRHFVIPDYGWDQKEEKIVILDDFIKNTHSYKKSW